MIIRILGEGQFEVPSDAVDALNEKDEALESAVTAGDTAAFETALNALLALVREVGTPLDTDSLDPSDVILPPQDATLDEVKELLSGDGLIPNT